LRRRAARTHNARMSPVLTTLRRTLLVPSMLPLTAVAMAVSWLGSYLAAAGLGGDEGFVQELRAGTLLFAGALVLSLAEPLELLREARGGLLLLRAARGGGFALGRRWLGLLLAALPTVLLCGWAAGGAPRAPVALLLDLGVLCAGGLLLGAFLERALLVPALWCLLVLAHLRPWLAGGPDVWRPVAWLLPRVGELSDVRGAAHALCWCAAVLLIADWRLGRVTGQGA
jgi:hypothetical protein